MDTSMTPEVVAACENCHFVGIEAFPVCERSFTFVKVGKLYLGKELLIPAGFKKGRNRKFQVISVIGQNGLFPPIAANLSSSTNFKLTRVSTKSAADPQNPQPFEHGKKGNFLTPAFFAVPLNFVETTYDGKTSVISAHHEVESKATPAQKYSPVSQEDCRADTC